MCGFDGEVEQDLSVSKESADRVRWRMEERFEKIVSYKHSNRRENRYITIVQRKKQFYLQLKNAIVFANFVTEHSQQVSLLDVSLLQPQFINFMLWRPSAVQLLAPPYPLWICCKINR